MQIQATTKWRVVLAASGLTGLALWAVPAGLAVAAQLPVPCPSAACGSIWVTSGAATGVQAGNSLTINQTTNRAIFNWASFNIGPDGTVTFQQPDANAIALNRIFDANPSQIFGQLNANGQLVLLNQNGFLFGRTARVNTGGLLASSLSLSDDTFNNGLLSAGRNLQPALAAAGNMANIVVQPGAQLTTNAAGQRILLSAKSIDNQGSLTANDGQVVLAAGDKLYLTASNDPALRGLLVEVDGGGTVTNTGSVTSERGNITAVGLAINQSGRMTATTSVAANGSINLLARDKVLGNLVDGKPVFTARETGSVELGNGSVTAVNPDATDSATAVDEQAQPLSQLQMMGKTLHFAGGSRLRAAGGNLTVVATTNPAQVRDDTAVTNTAAQIRVDDGAVIDLSGSTADTSVTRNLVPVELRSNELANAPLQRDGVLRGQTVVVDARVGTPLADVSNAIALIGRTVLERTSKGGSAVFDSDGDVVVAQGSTINVSGGAVNYQGGIVQTAQLIRADGSTVDIGKASPDATYIGLINPVYKQRSDRWGVVELIPSPGIGHFEPGYVVGSDAGSLQFMGSALSLNGSFVGNSINGSTQRSSGTLSRGGQFIVGLAGASANAFSFRASAIDLVSQLVPVSVAAGTPLPAGTPLYLSPELLREGGFSNIRLASDKSIVQSADTPVTLLPGGSLTLTAPSVEINAGITAPAGSLSFTTVTPSRFASVAGAGLRVANGVTLNVSGLWVNDALTPPDQTPTGALLTNGGGISLLQAADQGVLSLGDNVSLLANGGGWLQRSGAVAGGGGGSISILSANVGIVDHREQLAVGNNLRVAGFGIDGAAGGSVSLRAPRLRIAAGLPWLGAQQVTASGAGAGTLQVGTSLFTDFGFQNFMLQADHRALAGDITATALDVAAGASLVLAPQTLRVDATAGSRASGSEVTTFSQATRVTDNLARAASLNLKAASELDDNTRYGGLRFEAGTSVTGNAGSTVSLSSTGDLDFAGQIDVVGGKVTLATLAPTALADHGYVNRQLQVDAGSSIRVAGGTVLTPNDVGLRLGQVLDGGNVTIAAGRGSVTVAKGASIDISGAGDRIDVLPPQGGGYQTLAVASQAGTLTVQAQESVSLDGTLRAHGGSANGAENTGGTLDVSLLRSIGGVPIIPFPTGPRVLQVLNQPLSTPGNGIGAVGASWLAGSGIEAVNLAATDEVAVESGVNLTLARLLRIDAPRLSLLGGGSATLAAPIVTLGPSQTVASLPTATAGTGTLAVRANQLALQGTLALRNIGLADFQAQHDIMLQGYGVSAVNAALNGGSLLTGGDVLLQAERVFPTSGSAYTIRAPNHAVTIGPLGSSPGTPLSAAGSLTINAADITQGGTLLAPFGNISLNASNTLRLLPGSFTSVGSSSVIPYGRVDNGNSWVWGVDSSSATAVTATPDRQVTLNGARVDMASGATVDVSGGGDLLGYQYTPGTGGKLDVLDPKVASSLQGSFVIAPSGTARGAYDPMMWAGSSLQPGQSIHIGAGSSVPAGTYDILPLRYALLPGAYLVSPVKGYQDLPPGSVASTSDGAVIVSGYLGYGLESNPAARSSGFAIRPGSYARELAQYDDHLASTFFPAQAARNGLTALSPADAGTLAVAVTQSLNALATVQAQGAAGGSNAGIDVAAPSIEVHDSLVTGSIGGTVHLSAPVLQSWHAGSLLLGGQRDAATGDVTVSSSHVTIHSGATLSVDEVALVANQTISLESGATVATSAALGGGAAPPATRFAMPVDFHLAGPQSGSAAVLAVSDLRFLTPSRAAAPGTTLATINVDPRATLASRGAVALDAGGKIALADGTLVAQRASWSLGAGSIALGSAGNTGAGLALDGPLLASLRDARSINLQTSGSMLLNASTSLGTVANTTSIHLSAGAITATAANASLDLAASKIVLEGGDTAPGALAAGSSHAQLTAQQIDVNSGQLGFAGFSDVALQASGMIVGQGAGSLAVSGDLHVSAATLTAASDANTTLQAAGNVLLASTGTAPPAASTLQTGGTLTFSGTDITGAATIAAPSGNVTLSASRDLVLAAGTHVDVAGYAPSQAPLGADGGAIHLQAGRTLQLANGATLDVSAGPQADAGSIAIRAGATADVAATLTGAAGSGQRGGDFGIQAGALTGFTALSQRVDAGGFTNAQNYRVGSGDLVLGAGDTLTARQIELTADAGGVDVAGSLLAASATERGSITLNGRGGVTLADGAVLDVSAAQPVSQRGGSITLATTDGSLQLAAGARLQARGQGGSGTLVLRAPSTATDMALGSLPASLSTVDQVVLEPIRTFALSAAPTTTELNAIRTAVASFDTAAAGNLLARPALATAGAASVRPFIDMTHVGDLTLAALDLAPGAGNWRFGGQPAVLSFRATGNLSVNGTLSDGFSAVNTPNGPALDLLGAVSAGTLSSSLNLVAGADLGSASVVATQSGAASDLVLASGAQLRSGTGDITLAAARDVVFGAGASVYTGGSKAAASIGNDGAFLATFPSQGGSVSVLAGRDVAGMPMTQAVDDWQPRWAPYTGGGSGTSPLANWGVDPTTFRWNVGALGGGDVTIRSGRDVNDLSVALADSSIVLPTGRLTVGGGNLDFNGGRNINAAYAYVAHGLGTLRAGGAFGASSSRRIGGRPAGTLLLAGDSSFTLRATGDILFEGLAQPLLFDPNNLSNNNDSFIYVDRYRAASRLDIQSGGGSIEFHSGNLQTAAAFTGVSAGEPFNLYPATVTLSAFGGDLDLLGGFLTAPSAQSSLDLYASRDISGQLNTLAMSDVLPTVAGVGPDNAAADGASGIVQRLNNAAANVLHVADATPSQVVAGRDIDNLRLQLAEAATVAAGRDVIDTGVYVQQSGVSTTTVVSAGRDVLYTPAATTSEIRVGGSGQLEVLAGRNINLGFSKGISTTGRLLNGNLPNLPGADIVALAGLARQLDAQAFLDAIVGQDSSLQAALISYVSTVTAQVTDYSAANAAFRGYPQQLQLPFLVGALFKVLVASGREANADPTLAFKRGFAALAALLPGSGTAHSPYAGNISMPFSRVYTLDGGSVSLLAPGGSIDVGLANPPTFSTKAERQVVAGRTAADLGIVAERTGSVDIMANGDVLVNTSRIFTLGGGDIAIWSSTGNIDAGKGAKSAISAPPPTFTVDSQGNVSISVGSAVAGSGIRTILTDPNKPPGNVDLMAPAGFVNAGDAGIGSAGNLNIAAQRVVGLDNIQVGGTSTGVPPQVSGLGASLSGVTAAASSSSAAASNTVRDSAATDKAPTSAADVALSWLEVFVTGLGEENCRQDDAECLKRQLRH